MCCNRCPSSINSCAVLIYISVEMTRLSDRFLNVNVICCCNRAEVMITGDDDPPKMIGGKKHNVMTHSMDLSSPRMKKELLRQVKLSNNDSYVDEAVSYSV